MMVSQPHLRISLLGQVAVVSAGRAIGASVLAARQNRVLFAYLVAEQGRSVSRGELADALWGGAPPETWEKALTVIASKVRALLVEGGVSGSALTSERAGYRLELPAGTWVDVFVAAKAVDEADEALEAGDLVTAKERAGLAESLARLPLLAEEDGDWIETKRRELEEGRAQSLAILSEVSRVSGEATEATIWAERAVELEPFRETGYRRLMEAHISAGDRAEALRVYDQCRRLLAEELGAYPSPETQAMYRRLLEASDAEGENDSGSIEPAVTVITTAVSGRHRGRRVAFAAVILAGAAVAAVLSYVGQSGSAKAIVPNSVVRVDPSTLKVTEVASVADQPDLIIKSGGYLWITNHVLRDHGSEKPRNAGDHTLTRVDPSTGKAVLVGELAPCGITADPSGDVWVANCYSTTSPGLHDDVVRVAARTLAFKKTLGVPGGTGFFRSLAYGGGSLWVSQVDGATANTVTQLNPKTGEERTIPLARAAGGLAWSSASGDLWMANFNSDSLTRLRPTTGVTKIVTADLVNPSHSVVADRAVWVADWSAPQVMRLNAVGTPRPRRIPLPGGTLGVWDIAFGAGAIWATTPRDDALWRIDPETGRVQRVSIPDAPTGVAADAHNVWVTLRSKTRQM